MPELTITIGGRDYQVACQPGEEHFLQSAAGMLDAEASVLASQIGRLPETRMLLMSGLMLADKTAGLEDQLSDAQERLSGLEAEVQRLRDAPKPAPERIEVPVIPQSVTESLAELAARAEALAGEVEEKVAAAG